MIGLYEKVVYSNFKCRYNLIGHQTELRYDCSMCKFLCRILSSVVYLRFQKNTTNLFLTIHLHLLKSLSVDPALFQIQVGPKL